jgi:hypothetical protein
VTTLIAVRSIHCTLNVDVGIGPLRSSCGVLGRHTENSKHLLALDGASDRLQLVAADLLTPGAFDSIFEGCDGVFHTAAAVPGDDSVPAVSHLPSRILSC